MIEILDYEPKFKDAFKNLNYAWIDQYFEIEATDRQVLENPESSILEKGGAIIIASTEQKAVGTCALIKKEPGIYELAKMAVDKAHQGQKIGWKLGVATLEKAKELKASKVYLESNSQLTPAISLYKKLGFKQVNSGCSPYERCDVRMEILLK
ncbi:MAG: GNAT family N-acetyltransferase [Bacteroidota bacterium]